MAEDSVPRQAPTWPLVPSFPPDLFRGTAQFYARYRPPYPTALLDDLVSRVQVSGHGRLVDLACGTGELALALQGHFREVLAVDLEPEMVEVGRQRAQEAGVTNVYWSVGRAEDFAVAPGSVELVTVGNAFHRLDRRAIASSAREWLAVDGALVVAGSSSIWSSTAQWRPIVLETIDKWTVDRAASAAPAGSPPDSPSSTHEEVLRGAGFEVAEYDFPTPHRWTVDSFVGYLRSTSVLSKAERGGVAADLEAELRQRLLDYAPAGEFDEMVAFYYLLATPPAHPRR